MTNFREVLEQLDIPANIGAGPAGADGEWHQLLAAFGTKGFVRALTDGTDLALECAPPGALEAARGALTEAGWTVTEGAAPFVARREFPSNVDDMRDRWLQITKLADATRADDADDFYLALAPAAGPDAPKEPATSPTPAFESIGDEVSEARPDQSERFAFALSRSDDGVDAVLGFSEALERGEHDALEARLISNLRGKYDVDVTAVGAADVALRLPQAPRSRVSLKVRPAIGASLTATKIEDAVGEYLDTLRELAIAGIDPLVFLGARASKRNTGAFEAIGSSGGSPDEPHEVSLLIEDDVDDDPETADEVVFGESRPEADAPLEPGKYEDQRLKRLDATTSLVDVVLRHPGYSDRNMGQVMSILLSLDYASCLDINNQAPTVIAWGVARDRALTMKTVIEGAGGKVVLVEPGTFGED